MEESAAAASAGEPMGAVGPEDVMTVTVDVLGEQSLSVRVRAVVRCPCANLQGGLR